MRMNVGFLCGVGLLAASMVGAEPLPADPAPAGPGAFRALVAPKDKEVRVAGFVTPEGAPAPDRTVANLRWDDAGLTVTFECLDDNVTATNRPQDDFDVVHDDAVHLMLDPRHTHRFSDKWVKGQAHRFHGQWVRIIVSAAGIARDEGGPGYFTPSGEPQRGERRYTAEGLKTRAERTAGGWRAEIALPWEAIGGPPAIGDGWGLNLCRTDQPGDTLLCWSPTQGPLLNVHEWGHLVFADAAGQAGDGVARIEKQEQTMREGQKKRDEYVERVTRGEGFVAWQAQERVSPEEDAFRWEMEARKDALLAGRVPVRHPVAFDNEQLAVARRNIAQTAWGRAWFEGIKAVADHVAAQPDDYIERMIPELTPTTPYGFTCPNCAGVKSQEGMGVAMYAWDYRKPEEICCKVCGQAYPDARFPEDGRLVCPRRGQTFTFYRTEAERAHPEDRSGIHAWTWAKRPTHVSFAGIIRHGKIMFMTDAARSLALAWRLTGDPRYAACAVRVLERFAACMPNWLYHDTFGTFADCDPLYAAWHDQALKLEYKRHPCTLGYGGRSYETGAGFDDVDKARMLAAFFNSGRVHPSADTWILNNLARAYDLVHDAKAADGTPLWNDSSRRAVERDLILEHIFTAEPWLGGPGKAGEVSNKGPYVYVPMAHVGRVLGLPEYAHVALLGYEALRDQSFLSDGFSGESPAYTAMFLGGIIVVPETLHGFRWPRRFAGRQGTVNVYRDDAALRAIMRAQVESLRGNGKYLPLSDTLVIGAPNAFIFEIGRKRYPEIFAGMLPTAYRGQAGYVTPPENAAEQVPEPLRFATEYAVFNLRETEMLEDEPRLPEIFFPAWMTAVLRHGRGAGATELALPLNPDGIHRQADNLTLYYADRGQMILGEQGYVGDSVMLGWGASTLSHNLVVVNDREQTKAGRVSSLRLMATSPRVSVVEASSTAYAYAGCGEYRRLAALLKGPGAETVAVDIFRGRGGAKYAYQVFSDLAASDAPDGAREFAGLAMSPEPPIPNFGGSVAHEHIFGLRDAVRVENPPAAWQAVWRQAGRQYRLHMLSPAGRVEAANGPGQMTTAQVGRRVRYLNVINQGTNLVSTFVAVHEPSGPDGTLPVRAAERLAVPAEAGPDAVALRIDTRWGGYLVFSDFTGEAEVAGMRFKGQFGVFGSTPEGRRWRFTCGETVWTGKVASVMNGTIATDTPRPPGWPQLSEGVTAYVLAGDGNAWTGYPVAGTSRRGIRVDRFAVAPAAAFALPSVRYEEESR